MAKNFLDLTGARAVGVMFFAGMAATMIAAPVLAQDAPERGVFVTQIGDGSRATITQTHAESLARVVQNGNDNQLDLAQNGTAPHRAQIAQDGDGNSVRAQQDGNGSADLTLVQEGNANVAVVSQREIATAEQTAGSILQRGNGNSAILTQNGSDNSAALEQLGDGNTMTATQNDSGNRLAWSQIGDGLADLQITQTGGGAMQITQSTSDAQFAPAPSGTGG